MKARDAKSTKKPAKKTMTKKAAPKKTGRTSAPKPAKAVSKPPPSKAAAKKAKPAKKIPLKKPPVAQKTSAVDKKTGAGKKPSDETKKSVKISAARKPAKAIKKPAGAKTPAPSNKSSQVKKGKIPAPAAAKTRATGKKLLKPAFKEPATKKIAAKVSAAPVKKIGIKVKGPSSKEMVAAEKTAKTVKKPSAVKAEKTPVKAKPVLKKTAEKEKQKTPPKSVAEKIVPVKPEAKPARKSATPQKAGGKEQKPSPKKEAVSAGAAGKPAEEKKALTPKSPARKRAQPAVRQAAGTRGKTVAAKIPIADKKETILQAGPVVKPPAAPKKTFKKEPAHRPLSAAPEKPKLKIFLPGKEAGEEDIRENFVAALPEEYGENALIAMAVDPNTIFVDWEIVPGEIAGKEGDLTLRFHDITGIEFDGSNANAVIDIKIPQRVGNGFFVINMPGRDVIVEAGIVRPEGRFLTVMRSEVVSFPFLLTFDDLGIVQKLIISGIPVGY